MMINNVDQIDWSKITNVQWRAESCDEGTILFYKFNNHSLEEKKIFLERIEKQNYYCCITNYKNFDLDKGVRLSLEDFYLIQEESLNRLYPTEFLDKKIMLGVTGTNGKTTTVDLIRQISIQNKKNIMTVGTLGVYLNNQKIRDFHLTTPSYIDLRKTLYELKNDFEIFAMELSSIALEQNRLGSIRFDKIAWTNFTQDHLDYHHTMTEYFNAKLKGYEYLRKEKVIYIPASQSDLIHKIKTDHEVVEVKINSDDKYKNPFLKVEYNRENLALAEILLSHLKSLKLEEEMITPPPGRFNIVQYKNSYIVVDSAHTPDALKAICNEIKNTFKEYNLITIFGCGGDRDKAKRPLMAEVVSRYSDFTILTSDNPRYEDPKSILADAKKGLVKKFEIIEDRVEAIKYGIDISDKTILLIAGKGHENYLDIMGVKHPYNDMETVLRLIND